MLDLQPGIRVAVPGVDGPEMVAIRDLLPVAYARPGQEATGSACGACVP